MVDTTRTLASLQSLFADNNSGDISPQDLRDFLYSMKWPCGSIYLTTPSATTVSTPGTYVKANGTTAASDGTSAYLFTLGTSNRLTYTGTVTMHFHIVASVSFDGDTSNDVVGLRIAKNGTTLVHSTARRKIGAANDVGSTAIHADCSLSENDYVELWLTDETNSADITVRNLYLFAMGMFR